MTRVQSSPLATPVMGDDVAMEVLQWIGAFRALREALVISYNMQDYDFWGHGQLSYLLRRQISNGAKVTLLTTPPPGRKGTKKAFKDKLSLLENLNQNGVEIHLNEQLHAKAYIFLDDRELLMTIVGSPNLTSRGFGVRGTSDNWLELALLTSDPDVYQATVDLVTKKLLGHSETVDFATWVISNQNKIAQAKGGT